MINKIKNKSFTITFPKPIYQALENVQKAFEKEGIHVSKSIILVNALDYYIRAILETGEKIEEAKNKAEKGEIKDA